MIFDEKKDNVIDISNSNKQQIALFVNNVKENIVEGEINALMALSRLKMIEKSIAELLSNEEIEEAILLEAEKYTKDELLNLYGCEFEIRQVGVKYDFSKTDDTILFDLEKKKKSIDDKIKQRKDALKTLNSDGETFNEEGVQLFKATKKGKVKVITTIK